VTQRTFWQRFSTLAVGVALLGVAAQAMAGAGPTLCCVCTCPAGNICEAINVEGCPSVCGMAPGGPCGFEIANSTTCAGVAACAGLGTTVAPAPALGGGGLTLASLALAGLAALGIRRRQG
jgi:hypothetical protein